MPGLWYNAPKNGGAASLSSVGERMLNCTSSLVFDEAVFVKDVDGHYFIGVFYVTSWMNIEHMRDEALPQLPITVTVKFVIKPFETEYNGKKTKHEPSIKAALLEAQLNTLGWDKRYAGHIDLGIGEEPARHLLTGTFDGTTAIPDGYRLSMSNRFLRLAAVETTLISGDLVAKVSAPRNSWGGKRGESTDERIAARLKAVSSLLQPEATTPLTLIDALVLIQQASIGSSVPIEHFLSFLEIICQ